MQASLRAAACRLRRAPGWHSPYIRERKRGGFFLYPAGTLRISELTAEERAVYATLKPERLPEHVAIIMDGNGRWAGHRSLKRFLGHQQGAKSVQLVNILHLAAVAAVDVVKIGDLAQPDFIAERHAAVGVKQVGFVVVHEFFDFIVPLLLPLRIFGIPAAVARVGGRMMKVPVI